MASLMLINPRKRKSPARRKARRNPAASTAVAKAAPKRNPARKYQARMNPAKRRRVRRNPIGVGGIKSSLMNSIIGGAGAVGVDFIADMLPIPATMKTGWTGVATKAAIAVGVGMIGKKFLGRNAEKMAEGALTVLAYSSIKGLMPSTSAAVAGLAYVSPAQNAGYSAQLSEYLNPDPYAGSVNTLAGLGEYVTY